MDLGLEFEERIAFVSYVNLGGGEGLTPIRVLDLTSLSATEVLPATAEPLPGNNLSWGPTRQRLVLAKRTGEDP